MLRTGIVKPIRHLQSSSPTVTNVTLQQVDVEVAKAQEAADIANSIKSGASGLCVQLRCRFILAASSIQRDGALPVYYVWLPYLHLAVHAALRILRSYPASRDRVASTV